jgi:hypothetical protein
MGTTTVDKKRKNTFTTRVAPAWLKVTQIIYMAPQLTDLEHATIFRVALVLSWWPRSKTYRTLEPASSKYVRTPWAQLALRADSDRTTLRRLTFTIKRLRHAAHVFRSVGSEVSISSSNL